MIVNPDLDVHTKSQNQQKTLRKKQKTTTYWNPKEYCIPKYTGKLSGVRLLDLACQGGSSNPWHHVG